MNKKNSFKKFEGKTKKSLVLAAVLVVVAFAATFALTMIATVEEANALFPVVTNKMPSGNVCYSRIGDDGVIRTVCVPG